MAPLPPNYDFLSVRVASYTQGRAVRLITSKGAASKKTQLVKWPHDDDDFLATPDSLAQAGFYYAPAPGFPDQVQCFACDTSLDGWEPQDDPFKEHYSRAEGTCAWAMACCSLEKDRVVKGKKTT